MISMSADVKVGGADPSAKPELIACCERFTVLYLYRCKAVCLVFGR